MKYSLSCLQNACQIPDSFPSLRWTFKLGEAMQKQGLKFFLSFYKLCTVEQEIFATGKFRDFGP